MNTTPRTNARQRARAERIEQIRDAALVHQSLGQSARHERLPDGQHRVTYRGRRFRGATVEEAIDAAQGGGANT